MPNTPYFRRSDLEDLISAAVVRRIYDDNNDGSADASPIERLRNDATSIVNAHLRRIYPLPLAEPVPDLVVTLALEVAAGLTWQRFPQYVSYDGEKRLEAAMHMLKDLAKGLLRLDVQGAPEPAANEGGTVRSGDPLNPTPPPRLFTDGTGDF